MKPNEQTKLAIHRTKWRNEIKKWESSYLYAGAVFNTYKIKIKLHQGQNNKKRRLVKVQTKWNLKTTFWFPKQICCGIWIRRKMQWSSEKSGKLTWHFKEVKRSLQSRKFNRVSLNQIPEFPFWGFYRNNIRNNIS